MRQLQEHLRFMHRGLQMCPTCVTARRKFPLELETYTPQGLAAHQAAAHKHCEFCDAWFYAVDEVWGHMNQRHFLCGLCQAAGTPHLYFKDSAGLREHYEDKHFACHEGECAESGMVAFATAQELKDHQLERHSNKMPRFKKNKARQLTLELPTIIPRQAGRGQHQSWREQQEAEHSAGSSSSSSRRPAAAAAAAAAVEEFPDLSAAAAAAGDRAAAAAADSSRAAAAAAAAAPQLVKATAKCPCGRRQIHLAVRQGQQPAPLACDKECEQHSRRHQIADAFGVQDAEQHAAYWDRHRTPNYSPALLQAYKQDPLFIEQLERQLLAFLNPSSSKTPRLSLAPMPKAQRALAHEYAEEGFGLVSHSTGSEPNRAVQVFKTPSSGAPTQLLSQAAVLTSQAPQYAMRPNAAAVPGSCAHQPSSAGRNAQGHAMQCNWLRAPTQLLSQAAVLISQAALDAMLKGLPSNAAAAYTLRLVDVAPQAHLSHHLREWAGEYSLKTEAPGVVLLSFSSEKAYKAASETLAGGIRGVFRVERPAAAAAAGAVAGSSSSSSSSYRLPAVPPQQQQQSGSKGGSSSSSRSAAPAGAGSLAAAGWQTVSAGKARGGDAAAAAPPPDPWADDEKPSAAAAAAAAAAASMPVADDWEAEEDVGVEVPRGPALQLKQSNMWDALEAE
ncbi:hypothetical protein OEZ85_005603 [Tetradesmus obliquus]|uniref:R3H domain-containing protein n=1 Tax=Tetradesmus obliquus TaxID=3088 RepID=A0ABY8UDZ0_TETOB|nr:hypothetical protein OEZ85_005603 [Tetradesmus obliquus]